MPDRQAPTTTEAFRSRVPYAQERIHAAAVYCSDGRMGEAFDDFLDNGLKLPRYDRVAVPGGAACLAGHFSAYREGEAAIDQLRFLVEVHELKRIVLIAHQRCAFYTSQLRVQEDDLRERQLRDLARAATRARRLCHTLSVEGYFAAVTERHSVVFERVGV